ncbi:citrate/2-methylcitrate synthase [Schlesneria sp. T3-172]|uniref:citrate/2-methylcitrate synthase n=1 Tax=Schlesneria sphaerica TaxID=3373610 RepID=UPI0037C5203F
MTAAVSSSASEKEIAAEKAATRGLKGIIAADTKICDVNGDEGKLVYCGYNIHDLAQNSTFEETAYLLFKGELPTSQQLADFTKVLVHHREIEPQILTFLKSLPKHTPPMAALRSAISMSGVYDPTAEDNSPNANFEKAIRLTAEMTTIVAAIRRIQAGLEPVAPRDDLSHAANFMYMLNDKVPSKDAEKAMDLILILHAEHALNASTFAARVIAATLSDIYSSVTGAIGALKGPLHGGANTEVLKTLQEIGEVANVVPWVEAVRAKKGKFMGFGHAVYKVEDPRAIHLKDLSRRLGVETGDTKLYDISLAMEQAVKTSIHKNCNVDFYSASLQSYMGIPGDMFTCVFAASRIVGWCAHILEQLSDNKIIRPSSNYIGPVERAYHSIDQR